MCAPAVKGLVVEFDITSPTASTLAVTIYLLGLATGPMFLSPLSEIYGRVPVYHGSSLAFVAFMVGNALSKNIGQFMVFRFFSGCAGGTPMALGGGTIADVTRFENRGIAMALFSLGPLTGPVSCDIRPFWQLMSPTILNRLRLTHLCCVGSRSRHRGFYRCWQGLALDLLGTCNPRRRSWNRCRGDNA